MAGQAQTGVVHVGQACQIGVGSDSSAATVLDGVTRVVGGVVLVKEAQVGEVHEDAIADGAAYLRVCPVFLGVVAVVDPHYMVNVSALGQADGSGSVSVAVNGKGHVAATGKLDGVSRIGLVVVLVAMEEQDARCGMFSACGCGNVQLIGDVAITGADNSIFDIHPSVVVLNAVGHEHASRCNGQQDEQEKHRHFKVARRMILGVGGVVF